MDAARAALEAGDLETAAQYGKVYRLEPVDVDAGGQTLAPVGERKPSGTGDTGVRRSQQAEASRLPN